MPATLTHIFSSKAWGLVALVLCLFSGIYFLHLHHTAQSEGTAPSVPRKSGKEVSDPAKKIFTEKVICKGTEVKNVSIEYPDDRPDVRDAITRGYKKSWEELRTVNGTTREECKDGEIEEGDVYHTEEKYIKILSEPYTTYVYTTYLYMGGAHGLTGKHGFTIDNATGRLLDPKKFIRAEDVYPISTLAEVSVRNQIAERSTTGNKYLPDDTWIKEGAAPDPANYSTLWFEGDDLVIHFGQYTVAPYSEGSFEVRIPKSELEKIRGESRSYVYTKLPKEYTQRPDSCYLTSKYLGDFNLSPCIVGVRATTLTVNVAEDEVERAKYPTPVFIYLQEDEGVYSGSWNWSNGYPEEGQRADTPLGILKKEGRCYTNKEFSLCLDPKKTRGF